MYGLLLARERRKRAQTGEAARAGQLELLLSSRPTFQLELHSTT